MSEMRLLPAGSRGILVELPDLAQAMALRDTLARADLAGVTDLVAGARSLLVQFDPQFLPRAQLEARLLHIGYHDTSAASGREITVPMIYDGEDLADIAAHLGLTQAQVIARHQAARFRVAFTGFAPGFAYLSCDDPLFELPRRASPRLRIPAGSVALAGAFCGIYPGDSPGGWQLLGRTHLRLWDAHRAEPALLQAGDHLRFVAVDSLPPPEPLCPAPATDMRSDLRVSAADLPLYLQDMGRIGRAGQGLARSGALDQGALGQANALLGNGPDLAAIEVAGGRYVFEIQAPVTLAVTGAPRAVQLCGPTGAPSALPFGAAVGLDPGDRLLLGPLQAGARSYLAARGGIAAPQILGARSRDTLAGLGPLPLGAGSALAVGPAPRRAVATGAPAPAPLLRAGEVVTLDVLAGPRWDWFAPAAQALFLATTWQVGAAADRVGLRLEGAEIAAQTTAELPSEGTPQGAIQIPRGGAPVLFLADHPVTGGYPVIAVLADYHFDLAGQIPAGARIRFRLTAPFTPICKGLAP